jgi:glutamate/tyrosine decarboxylase-like PLP-dependent enzyme
MSPEHLQQILDECVENQTPILAVIGVLGSTEFGTVDPIGDIIDLRDEFAERGLHFPVHVDAAWGGIPRLGVSEAERSAS